MKSSDRNLRRIVALARNAAPHPNQPMSPEDSRFFSPRTAAAWSRQRGEARTFDALRLWELVGVSSLAASIAVVLLVIVLSPPAVEADPFGPWVQDEAVETL